MSNWLKAVWVVGPYVVVDRGHQDTDTSATVVDTRSGAVTSAAEFVTGADGGTIAMQLQENKFISFPGIVRSDALPPLSC